MKEKIVISKRNRDIAKIWLERIEDNKYVIKSDKQYVLDYMRYMYDKVPNDAMIYDFEYNDGTKGIYTAIDPSGGPYINLGYEIENYKVIRFLSEDNNFYIFWRNILAI